MIAKYKGKEIKVFQIFPYSKTIILSSSTIPDYSKGGTLTFSYYLRKNTEINISSRVIDLKKGKNNEALTELKLFETYYTILGGDSGIIKECFYMNEKYYNKSTEFSISGYSFNGVKIYQVNNDYNLIGNEIEIKNGSNYFTYDTTISDKFCIESLSSYLTGINFQVIDMKNLTQNQNKISKLIRTIPLKFYLKKDQIIYYPIDILSLYDNQTFLINVNVTNGNPEFGYGYCNLYPFNCIIENINNNKYGLYESEKKELENNFLKFKKNMIKNIEFTYFIIIKCPSEKCEYTLIYYGDKEKEFMKPSKDNNFNKINQIIKENEVNNYLLNIDDSTITDIYIILSAIVGNVDLTVKKNGLDIGEFIPLVNKEIIHIDKNKLNDLIGFYSINIQSKSIAEYSLYYYTSNKSISYIKYIELGLMDEQSITFEESKKKFLIINPYKSNKNQFLIMINSLNCKINATFNGKYYSEKQNQIILESNDNLYSKDEYPIEIELISFDSGNKIKNEKCIFYIGGYEINQNNPIKLKESINYAFKLTETLQSLTFYHQYKISSDLNNRKDINLVFDKESKGILNIIVSVFSFSKDISTEYKEIKELKLSESNSFNTLILNQQFLNKGCKNNKCNFTLTISSKELSKNKSIKFNFEILGENKSPYYLPEGEMILDIIKLNKYQYYFSDIKSNSNGEIIFNFNQINASVIGRIIRKNETDKNPTWNKRVRLPLITDSIDKDNGIIEFDYYNKKLIFNENNTKDCDKSGCEIFIAILVNLEDSSYRDNLFVNYSIFMKYNGQDFRLNQDEHIIGCLNINEIKTRKEINIPNVQNFKSTVSKIKVNYLKLIKDNISDQSMKIQISLSDNFEFYYAEYNLSTEIFENKDKIKSSLRKFKPKFKNGKYIFLINNISNNSFGIILYIIYNKESIIRNIDNEKNEESISISYKSYNNEIVPEFNNYIISNSSLNITYSSYDDTYIISFNPITFNNKVVEASYILYLYSEDDYDIRNLNKFYPGKATYSNSQYYIKNNKIIFTINNEYINYNNYYVIIKATINNNNGDEYRFYIPRKLIEQSEKQNYEQEKEEEENEVENEEEEYYEDYYYEKEYYEEEFEIEEDNQELQEESEVNNITPIPIPPIPPDPVPIPDPIPDPVPDPNPIPDPKPKPDPDSEPNLESDTNSESETISESETNPETKPETESNEDNNSINYDNSNDNNNNSTIVIKKDKDPKKWIIPVCVVLVVIFIIVVVIALIKKRRNNGFIKFNIVSLD